MCRPRECPRLEEIRGKLRTRVCIHFPAGALQPEAWHLPSVFRYSHTSQELHWTRLTTPRVLWVTVTPLITMAVAISPSFSGFKRKEKGVGMARKRGSIEREGENECMTPAYCARSNDIRVIIPASRECLLTLDAQDIFSPYCTLSSNAVLIKARSWVSLRLLWRSSTTFNTFPSHSLREIVAVYLLFFLLNEAG